MVILKLLFWLVPFMVVFCGLSVFSSKRKHLLNVLLSLEFVMLGVFCVLIYSLSVLSGELYFVLIFLAMVACEAALGLSILVSSARTHGNDYFNSFTFFTMLKFLISSAALILFAGNWEVVQFFLFVLSFVISLKCAHNFFIKKPGYMMGIDYLSYALILLSVWIVALMVCSIQKIYKAYNFSGEDSY